MISVPGSKPFRNGFRSPDRNYGHLPEGRESETEEVRWRTPPPAAVPKAREGLSQIVCDMCFGLLTTLTGRRRYVASGGSTVTRTSKHAVPSTTHPQPPNPRARVCVCCVGFSHLDTAGGDANPPRTPFLSRERILAHVRSDRPQRRSRLTAFRGYHLDPRVEFFNRACSGTSSRRRCVRVSAGALPTPLV